MRSHSNGREKVGSTPLHVDSLEGIGVVANPEFVKPGEHTVVCTTATACTCLYGQVGILGADAVKHFGKTFVIVYVEMALIIG